MPPDHDVGSRTALPQRVTGSARLDVRAQYAGRHRDVPFQAAELARPPRPGSTAFERVSVVCVPRRVPGPRVEIARRGAVAEDAAFARTVLPPLLTAALAQDPRARRSPIALEPDCVAALRTGPLTPEGLGVLLDLLVDIDPSVPWQSFAPQG